ncbi:hypothetical protein EDD18DRAFT_1108171 [Armillaria luteobubalina]|uniref:Uncharacterized protein n=1 Tax=Armillaria luteobubalina TaxID=153913 RepID=A0AA39Q090_9AGAR|nr:hypothetical protein EDD18DRAFT_1108171 [Armillaria luteobubalina]
MSDPLKNLASSVPADAYAALAPILTTLAQCLSKSEGTLAALQAEGAYADHISNALQYALSNASFQLPAAPTAPTTTTTNICPHSLHVDLPKFHGTLKESVRAFLSIIQDHLEASHIPKDDWGVSNLEMQLDDKEMTFSDCHHYFTCPLPPDLGFHISNLNPHTMAKVYDITRNWACHKRNNGTLNGQAKYNYPCSASQSMFHFGDPQPIHPHHARNAAQPYPLPTLLQELSVEVNCHNNYTQKDVDKFLESCYTTMVAFAKFTLQIGTIKETNLAYILEVDSGFSDLPDLIEVEDYYADDEADFLGDIVHPPEPTTSTMRHPCKLGQFAKKLKDAVTTKFPRLFWKKVGYSPSHHWVHHIDTGNAQLV